MLDKYILQATGATLSLKIIIAYYASSIDLYTSPSHILFIASMFKYCNRYQSIVESFQ